MTKRAACPIKSTQSERAPNRTAEMRTAAVITARNTSRRLPGKGVVEIGGRPAIAHMIERLKAVALLDDIVLASTANPEDAPIHDVAKSLGVKSFAGSEHDVLGRLAGAARSVDADIIVYCTGDCIFLDPAIVTRAILEQRKTGAAFVSNCIPRSFIGGMDVEVLKRAVVERLDAELTDPWDREHITEHVYLRPSRYPAHYFQAPEHLAFPRLQVCLDTAKDLELLRLMYADLAPQSPLFDAEAMTAWLNTHPKQAGINQVTRKQSYKVGVVGLGKIAWSPASSPDAPDYWTHCDAIACIPDLQIDTVVETDGERLAAFLKCHPHVRGYQNFDEMLAGFDGDILYVCTPTAEHLPMLRRILESSRVPLVFCEKPIGDRFDESRAVADVFKAQGRHLVVNYWTRWSDAHARLKAEMAVVGALRGIVRTYSLGLFNSGTYAIDQLRDLCGEISAVQALASVPTVRADDDGISAVIYFASGAPPALLIALDGRRHITTDTDILAEGGRLRLVENDTKFEIYRPSSGAAVGGLVLARVESYTDMTPFLGLAQSAINFLRFGRPPPVTAEDAVRAVEVCEAIKTSYRQNNTRIEL
jgi:spore coat polysaccharide biosynthesis protein SpsF